MTELLIDTHAHLYDDKFNEDFDEVIKRCETLSSWINVASDLKTSKFSLETALKYPKSWASVGIHPHDAKEATKKDLLEIESLLKEKKVVACGEMGLDYFYDFCPKEIQIEIFKKQVILAKEASLPCIIHVREAFDDFFKVIDSIGYYNGVVHCYSGNSPQAKECLERGYYLGFGGMITFKNAKKPKRIMQETPIEKILIETDCPYMAPVPKRGKRNEPSFVEYVARAMAELREITYEEVCQATYNNAKNCFKI